jgi:hypothetical protein
MKPVQPKIKKGTEFTGWATFNWGMCHQRVYRTRKEAMAACIGVGEKGSTWDSDNLLKSDITNFVKNVTDYLIYGTPITQ